MTDPLHRSYYSLGEGDDKIIVSIDDDGTMCVAMEDVPGESIKTKEGKEVGHFAMTYIGEEEKEGFVKVECSACGLKGQVHPSAIDPRALPTPDEPDQKIRALCGPCSRIINDATGDINTEG